MPLSDYNDYGGFDSSPIYSPSVTAAPGSVSTAAKPASNGHWYDGLSDFAGSIVDTAVKVGLPLIAANQAKAASKANPDAVIMTTGRVSNPSNPPAGSAMAGVPKWVIYAGAAVVGVGVLALVVRAARR